MSQGAWRLRAQERAERDRVKHHRVLDGAMMYWADTDRSLLLRVALNDWRWSAQEAQDTKLQVFFAAKRREHRDLHQVRMDAALRRWGGDRSHVAMAAVLCQWHAQWLMAMADSRASRARSHGSASLMTALARLAHVDRLTLLQAVLLRWWGGAQDRGASMEAEVLRLTFARHRLRHLCLVERATAFWGDRDQERYLGAVLTLWGRAASRGRSVRSASRHLEEQNLLLENLKAAEVRVEENVLQLLATQVMAFECEAEGWSQDMAKNSQACEVLQDQCRRYACGVDDLEREVELLQARIVGEVAERGALSFNGAPARPGEQELLGAFWW